MEMTAEDYSNSLAHYGILRKSGRYPWGSGANPKQRSKTFLDILKQHEADGLSEREIAKLYEELPDFPFTVNDLRAVKTRSVHIQTADKIRRAEALAAKGYSNSEIGRKMGINESSVRSLRAPGRLERLETLQKTADMLKRQVEEKATNGGLLDVGAHVERDLPIDGDPNIRIGISKDKFQTAVSMLKEEGYAVSGYRAPQQGTGEMTNYKVLFKPPRRNMTPDELKAYAFANRNNLRLITEKTTDGGKSWNDAVFKKPLNIDSKRLGIQYKEDGGANADGVIYVRPGVKDISLGKSQYAQVRVAVDGTHFLKGMAVYKDDLPQGVDLLFNTNKSNTGNKLDALKELKTGPDGKVDWTNPFGAFPKIEGGQILDKDGNVESAMNLLNEAGDWNTWSKTVSRQVLAKQSPDLAKNQLDVTYDRKLEEFETLKSLTNPLIKRKLVETFADETDSSAVHLKAASLPKQATRVILPVQSLKPHEIFAPTFPNGTRVSLVRFPHAGLFEIPELTVNNRNPEARKLFTKPGTKKIEAPDAVGIHPKVAEHLSGADFDGDHVVVIPNNRGLIKRKPPLEGLKNFDPRETYKPYDGMRTIDGGIYNAKTGKSEPRKNAKGQEIPLKTSNKGNEMGKVTNLIADMTVKGAKDDELAAAVRHSMVVIDAEKHHLDYKASERANGIPALKKKYQGVAPGGQLRGASTLITRATAQERVDKRKAARSNHPGSGEGVTRLFNTTVDNKTGERVTVPTGQQNQHGEPVKFRSRKLAETKNAFDLISDHGGTEIERIYARHSNRLKDLANQARLEAVRSVPNKKNTSAAKTYAAEVKSLKAKLNEAQKNAPHERKAHRVADLMVAQRRRANPDMEKSEIKKIKGQALEAARVRVGAKKDPVPITDREWDAIQAHAVSIETLKQILNNTDVDKLKERATPRKPRVMTSVVRTRALNMLNSGFTYAEISEALGIPPSTLQSSLEGG